MLSVAVELLLADLTEKGVGDGHIDVLVGLDCVG